MDGHLDNEKNYVTSNWLQPIWVCSRWVNCQTMERLQDLLFDKGDLEQCLYAFFALYAVSEVLSLTTVTRVPVGIAVFGNGSREQGHLCSDRTSVAK